MCLAAAGDAGYRGQEGYRTHLTDPDAAPNQGPPQRSTGLMLLGARDYDPVLGRFMEPDPTEYDPGGIANGLANRWVYCGNDPVNASDPTGNAVPLIIVIVAAVIAIGLLLLHLVPFFYLILNKILCYFGVWDPFIDFMARKLLAMEQLKWAGGHILGIATAAAAAALGWPVWAAFLAGIAVDWVYNWIVADAATARTREDATIFRREREETEIRQAILCRGLHGPGGRANEWACAVA